MDFEFLVYVSFLCSNYTATMLKNTAINTPCTITKLIS